MPVKLYTGLPGAGKTARLVAEIVALREKEPNRPVYARGIDGLAEGLAEPLPDEVLHKWWELPPGAILCIDECQEPGLMPQDRGQPPDWVRRISKVRHEGMDFLLTTQHPSLMSSYVRRLVDQHVHAVRKFNTKVVMWYTWGRCMDTPEKGSSQKAAVSQVGTLPASVFDLYKSAQMHTMKRRLPFKVYAFLALIVLAITAAVAVPILIKRAQTHNVEMITGKRADASSSGAAAESAAERAAQVNEAMRAQDFGKWMRPRVAGLPWTAPAFDGQAVTARPMVYCIAVEDGGCSCISEQGTKVDVEPRQCRRIASNGVYNPFLPPADDARSSERAAGSRTSQSPQGAMAENGGPLPLSAAPTGAIGGYRRGPSFRQSYIPPEALPANQ